MKRLHSIILSFTGIMLLLASLQAASSEATSTATPLIFKVTNLYKQPIQLIFSVTSPLSGTKVITKDIAVNAPQSELYRFSNIPGGKVIQIDFIYTYKITDKPEIYCNRAVSMQVSKEDNMSKFLSVLTYKTQTKGGTSPSACKTTTSSLSGGTANSQEFVVFGEAKN